MLDKNQNPGQGDNQTEAPQQEAYLDKSEYVDPSEERQKIALFMAKKLLKNLILTVLILFFVINLGSNKQDSNLIVILIANLVGIIGLIRVFLYSLYIYYLLFTKMSLEQIEEEIRWIRFIIALK